MTLTTDSPTVRLIIDADKPQGMIGCADVGAAITDRTISLADAIAKALKRHGYSGCRLTLDANENLEADKLPACSVCEGRGYKLVGSDECGYSTSTCWACGGRAVGGFA
jgi:hypothetical protein